MKNVGFISTRLAGTDGVSLETYKWYQVLERNGFKCYAFAGELGTPKDRSFLEPKAHFADPEILEIHEDCFGKLKRKASLSRRIHELSDLLKSRLYEFCTEFDIDLLIPENALAIPMHIPLGMAITEFIAETGMPAVAHHHDFVWERSRFLINSVQDFLDYSFPPRLNSIRHVVINSAASRDLSYRRGISNDVAPNVFDFKTPSEPTSNALELRKELGFEDGELFVLQPTRIVPRKWIERGIELVNLLNLDRPRLIISHELGDEGDQYVLRIMEYSHRLGVEVICIGDMIGASRGFVEQSEKNYTIDDVYHAADLVVYPSGYEGFGNAFVEAVYFKKPIVLNRYSIYIEDIEPCGFDVIPFDGFVTLQTVKQLEEMMEPKRMQEATDKNYKLGQTHFSYEVLEDILLPIIESCFR